MTSEADFLRRVLKGDEGAVEVCVMLGHISQVWDDLIDGDDCGKADINRAFMMALLQLPSHAFYQDHFARLQPVMQIAVYDWLASNQLMHGDTHDKTLAFVLRDSLVAVVQQCAFIVGGHDYAIQVTPEIRRYYHDETLVEFLGDDT